MQDKENYVDHKRVIKQALNYGSKQKGYTE